MILIVYDIDSINLAAERLARSIGLPVRDIRIAMESLIKQAEWESKGKLMLEELKAMIPKKSIEILEPLIIYNPNIPTLTFNIPAIPRQNRWRCRGPPNSIYTIQ